MPKVNWGLSRGTVEGFDRSSQYKPYDGPLPPAGMYRWLIKRLKYVAATGEKNPQIRAGLELVPRNKEEKRYATYYITAFLTVSEQYPGFYVPFLDAIGVSENEFLNGTITDEEGNIKKIGKWRNTGDVHLKAQLRDSSDQHGNPRKEIGYIGADSGEAEFADDEDAGDLADDFDLDEDEYADEDAEDADWDEE
jgi:hypothetical protein